MAASLNDAAASSDVIDFSSGTTTVRALILAVCRRLLKVS